MARKRREKEKVTDPFERVRLKKLRAAQRREERKARRASSRSDEPPPRRDRSSSPQYTDPMVKDDYLWVRRGLAKGYAMRILNEHRERPYWLCIAHGERDGALPVPNFHPCTIFRTKTRAYFGFLFREHRDLFFTRLDDAVKVTTDHVRNLNPQLF